MLRDMHTIVMFDPSYTEFLLDALVLNSDFVQTFQVQDREDNSITVDAIVFTRLNVDSEIIDTKEFQNIVLAAFRGHLTERVLYFATGYFQDSMIISLSRTHKDRIESDSVLFDLACAKSFRANRIFI